MKTLRKVSYEEKMVAVFFGLTAFAWATKSFLLTKLIPAINDTIIALIGVCCCSLFPGSPEKEL